MPPRVFGVGTSPKFVEGRAQPPPIQGLVYFESLFQILGVDAHEQGTVDLGPLEGRGVCWLFRGLEDERRDVVHRPGPRVRRLVGGFDVRARVLFAGGRVGVR